MIDNFPEFSSLVEAQYNAMSQRELFVVGDGDALYAAYLDAFPVGTNPIYKERTEHDCTCCRNFIKNIGPLVTFVDGVMVTVWDIINVPEPYATVTRAMADKVRSMPIRGVFRSKESQYGTEMSRQKLDTNQVISWSHFSGIVHPHHHTNTPDADLGEINTKTQVLRRGLDEFTSQALTTVVALITEDNIYRGAEHLEAVRTFIELHNAYKKLNSAESKDEFIWKNANSFVAKFRNTVIGSLVQDLSSGVALDGAVRSFESKVAPTNYKRPKALVTAKMVEDAIKTIADLGIEQALQRRFAAIADVSINNVIWADGDTASQMKDGIAGLLADVIKPVTVDMGKAIPINVESFISEVLPKATTVEVYMRNKHVPNMVSLTAPVTEDSRSLFKWDNDFAWSYNGDTTDSSIKEKVKRAGGNVTAPLRVSLSWGNFDDLDIHVTEPSGNTINFRNRGYSGAGNLDIDMNAGSGHTREPVENICWPKNAIKDGVYVVRVNNFSRRESIDHGFFIEVESNGEISQFSYPHMITNSATVNALRLIVKGGVVVEITTDPKVLRGAGSVVPVDVWGVKTEQFVRVNTIMKSPNYWDGNSLGNKHWFFMLAGCKNPEPTRGIYNEYLHAGLSKHSKVFEVLGDKTKCQPTDDQLSGVGFSSTRTAEAVVRVKGPKLQATYNVIF